MCKYNEVKLTYDVFVEELQKKILELSGLERERIYFRKKGEDYAAEGERLVVEFFKGDDRKEAASLNTQSIYERYLSGSKMAELADEAMEEIYAIKSAGFYRKVFELSNDYAKIRSDLYVKTVNFERNRMELQDAIYQLVEGEIALVVYVHIGNVGDREISMKLRKELSERWGMDEMEIYRTALQNTASLTPPRVYYWEKLLFNPRYEGDELDSVELPADEERRKFGLCLSTTKRRYGATAIFMDDIAEKLSNIFDDDLYVNFSSIHEVFVHGKRSCDVRALQELLLNVLSSETVREDEILTRNVYCYERGSGKLYAVDLSGGIEENKLLIK